MRETTSEWITEQLEQLFQSRDKAEMDRAYPVMLLLMARDFGMENLEPHFADKVVELLRSLGIQEATPQDEVARRVSEYVESLEIDETILADLKAIFDQHYHALGETIAQKFIRKVLKSVPTKRAPMMNEPRPPGTVLGEELARQLNQGIRV